MINEVTVNLAPVINLIIYILIFLTIRYSIRKIVKHTYGRRILRICKTRVTELFIEHYKEYEFKEPLTIHSKVKELNHQIKTEFGLRFAPIELDYYDDYHYTYGLSQYFGIKWIHIEKRTFFYRIDYKVNLSDKMLYKNCMRDNRNDKIDNLLS